MQTPPAMMRSVKTAVRAGGLLYEAVALKRAGQVIAVASLLLCSCGSRATDEDREVIASAEAEYVEDFDLRTKRDIYIIARGQRGPCPSQEAAEGLFRRIFLHSDGTRRTDTVYTYLNFENVEGEFCFQLYWDRRKSAISRSEQGYY